MTPRHATLCLEQLDDRIVPSVTASHTPLPAMAPPMVHSMAMMQTAPSPDVQAGNSLVGYGQGQYVHQWFMGIEGDRYQLQGSATLGDLGQVSVKGFVQAPNGTGVGHAFGSLTFANAHGSVTVKLQGAPQTSLTAIPASFQFQVVSGTGAYSNFSDQGTLVLNLIASSAYRGTFAFSI